jgi:glycerophosphoryl diester phosphodiesterase
MVAAPVLDARGVVVLPALYAHRLGRVPGPDSSRAALQATLSGPVDGLETDVCLTAEGRLALLHDPWLQTGTTGTGWAHETPWREVRDLRLRDRFGVVSAERPMLLDELLDSAPVGLVVQLDVKTMVIRLSPSRRRKRRAGWPIVTRTTGSRSSRSTPPHVRRPRSSATALV